MKEMEQTWSNLLIKYKEEYRILNVTLKTKVYYIGRVKEINDVDRYFILQNDRDESKEWVIFFDSILCIGTSGPVDESIENKPTKWLGSIDERGRWRGKR